MPPIEIYSTDTDSGLVSVVGATNGAHHRIAQVSVGNAPRGAVKFTSDGRGFVCNCGGDTISEIDVITHRETTRIKVGPAPRGLGIIPGDRFALVSNSGANTISVVDLTSRRELAQVAVGRDPRHMAVTPNGKFAYVAVWGGHYVAKLDISALSSDRPVHDVLETVREVARIPVGGEVHPYSVALQPKSDRLWVANTQGTSVTIIDTSKDEVVAAVELGSRGARAVAFSPDESTAFVTIENVSQVAVVNTASLTVVDRIPVGPGPRGIAVDPQSMTMYVAAFSRLGGGGIVEDPPVGTAAGTTADNTVTVVELQPTLASLVAGGHPGKARTEHVKVGMGPCAVAILDTTKLRLGGAKKDH